MLLHHRRNTLLQSQAGIRHPPTGLKGHLRLIRLRRRADGLEHDHTYIVEYSPQELSGPNDLNGIAKLEFFSNTIWDWALSVTERSKLFVLLAANAHTSKVLDTRQNKYLLQHELLPRTIGTRFLEVTNSHGACLVEMASDCGLTLAQSFNSQGGGSTHRNGPRLDYVLLEEARPLRGASITTSSYRTNEGKRSSLAASLSAHVC